MLGASCQQNYNGGQYYNGGQTSSDYNSAYDSANIPGGSIRQQYRDYNGGDNLNDVSNRCGSTSPPLDFPFGNKIQLPTFESPKNDPHDSVSCEMDWPDAFPPDLSPPSIYNNGLSFPIQVKGPPPALRLPTTQRIIQRIIVPQTKTQIVTQSVTQSMPTACTTVDSSSTAIQGPSAVIVNGMKFMPMESQASGSLISPASPTYQVNPVSPVSSDSAGLNGPPLIVPYNSGSIGSILSSIGGMNIPHDLTPNPGVESPGPVGCQCALNSGQLLSSNGSNGPFNNSLGNQANAPFPLTPFSNPMPLIPYSGSAAALPYLPAQILPQPPMYTPAPAADFRMETFTVPFYQGKPLMTPLALGGGNIGNTNPVYANIPSESQTIGSLADSSCVSASPRPPIELAIQKALDAILSKLSPTTTSSIEVSTPASNTIITVTVADIPLSGLTTITSTTTEGITPSTVNADMAWLKGSLALLIAKNNLPMPKPGQCNQATSSDSSMKVTPSINPPSSTPIMGADVLTGATGGDCITLATYFYRIIYWELEYRSSGNTSSSTSVSDSFIAKNNYDLEKAKLTTYLKAHNGQFPQLTPKGLEWILGSLDGFKWVLDQLIGLSSVSSVMSSQGDLSALSSQLSEDQLAKLSTYYAYFHGPTKV